MTVWRERLAAAISVDDTLSRATRAPDRKQAGSLFYIALVSVEQCPEGMRTPDPSRLEQISAVGRASARSFGSMFKTTLPPVLVTIASISAMPFSDWFRRDACNENLSQPQQGIVDPL
jgi:hypothetical protein